MRINKNLYILVFAVCLALPHKGQAQSLGDFFHAVRADDVPTAARLLNLGLDPDSTNRNGNTVLIIAARRGYADMVKLLLAHKAAVDARNAVGDTALMAAAYQGHLGVVRLLVEHGAAVNRPGWSPLAYAAYAGKAGVVRYLLAHGAAKNAPAPNGYTPLMLAVSAKHPAAARELLYADADTNYRAADGATALVLARREHDATLVRLLRNAGARR